MLTLEQIASKTETTFKGNPTTTINKASSLVSADSNSIAFVLNQKILKKYSKTNAAILIVPSELSDDLEVDHIISSHPEFTFVQVLNLLDPQSSDTVIHPSVIMGEQVSLGSGVQIGAGCIIEDNVSIGDATVLRSRVTICQGSKIGKNCILHPGVIIGSDGFGLTNHKGKWVKIPQIGRAIIKDEVEIGANTTVDRGALDDTIIHSGVKLDNLIQVAHNVEIGENTAIAACVGIAGSAKIGKNCQISGQAVVLGHLSIADNVIITAMSLVTKSIKTSGVFSSGTPLLENKQWHKNNARYKHLDTLANTLKEIQKKINL